MSANADDFERHVEVDDGVLATSAPLEMSVLDHIILQVSEGLVAFPELRRQTYELRTQLIETKVIGSAAAISGMLALLQMNTEALTYFKSNIVAVLTGQGIPLRPPRFGGYPSDSEALDEQSLANEMDSPIPITPTREAFSAPTRSSPTRASSPSPPALRTSRPNESAGASTKVGSSQKSPAMSTRKRSIDASSAETIQIKEEKRPRINSATTANPIQRKISYCTADIDQEDREAMMNPIYTVPTQWEELYYKPVEVININSVGAKEHIQALRFAGTPFVIEGHEGWMKFSADWLGSDGKLDTTSFLRGIHDVKVPVIERNYEEAKPIKTHLALSHYVKNYWEKGKPDYYMHQWQFPLSAKAAKLLCYKCNELPVIGDNLLLYWLDAVRGDNPLQYFFMGQRSTTSRMHQDPGGLDITIAPIVGTKRVTMMHRSAMKVESVHETVNFHEVDLDKSPLLAFIPAWQVDVKPGQILYMPEGTLHACKNITECLSYHRFHVDAVNLPGFLASFMAQDSPTINHAEILWNAAHDVMAALEENYHANGQEINNTIPTLRKLDSLRALRHACRVLSLEEAVPTGDSWDWNKLLEDIDHLLVRIDARAAQQAKKNSNHAAVIGSAVPALRRTTSSSSSSSPLPSKKALTVATPSPARRKREAAAAAASATHWDSLNLKVGDVIGVQVFEKRNRAEVLQIRLNMELVQIHYVDWSSIYDEFLPVSSLFHRVKRQKVPLKKAPKVHEPVFARWGSNGELYNAIVLKVIRSNACFVHYLKYEKDWDQWILPGHIFRKYEPLQ